MRRINWSKRKFFVTRLRCKWFGNRTRTICWFRVAGHGWMRYIKYWQNEHYNHLKHKWLVYLNKFPHNKLLHKFSFLVIFVVRINNKGWHHPLMHGKKWQNWKTQLWQEIHNSYELMHAALQVHYFNPMVRCECKIFWIRRFTRSVTRMYWASESKLDGYRVWASVSQPSLLQLCPRRRRRRRSSSIGCRRHHCSQQHNPIVLCCPEPTSYQSMFYSMKAHSVPPLCAPMFMRSKW